MEQWTETSTVGVDRTVLYTKQYYNSIPVGWLFRLRGTFTSTTFKSLTLLTLLSCSILCRILVFDHLGVDLVGLDVTLDALHVDVREQQVDVPRIQEAEGVVWLLPLPPVWEPLKITIIETHCIFRMYAIKICNSTIEEIFCQNIKKILTIKKIT